MQRKQSSGKYVISQVSWVEVATLLTSLGRSRLPYSPLSVALSHPHISAPPSTAVHLTKASTLQPRLFCANAFYSTNASVMTDRYQSGHQEVVPCLLSDYDDDVEAHRENFHAFMARQAEEHWAAEINSLDIEGSANRIATVIDHEVNKLTQKLDVIATAMAAEADGAEANRLLAMVPSRINLMARLEDLAFSRLQPVRGLADRPLAIEDASSSDSKTSTRCEISERQGGCHRTVGQSPPKKRSKSPVKIESPSPTKRRRVTFSQGEPSLVIEPPPASSGALQPSPPSSAEPPANKSGHSTSRKRYPSLSPLPSQSRLVPAQHAATADGGDKVSENAPSPSHKMSIQPNNMKPAVPSNPRNRKYSNLPTIDIQQVYGYDWIFQMHGSHHWCILRCQNEACLTQGPFTGGIFDTGSHKKISSWVKNSNELIRQRNNMAMMKK
ncbi:hypothetical protein QBC41DRAFT_218201 [Cercophora samala]|uniref:Uncharacterized protein n=1 Tax=Cercophora samala TaxID=330535 RepID=A0AA40DCS6_9PEZI|nr:hypothetical protein QBC41DRAFT_218201 [Cercophora samala]